MQCVRCERCELETREIDAVPVDVCMTCGSGAVEQRYLNHLIQAAAKRFEGDPASITIEERPDSGETRTCHKCERPMRPFQYLGSRLLVLDRCDHCHIVWMDPGEIDSMVRFYLQSEFRKSEQGTPRSR